MQIVFVQLFRFFSSEKLQCLLPVARNMFDEMSVCVGVHVHVHVSLCLYVCVSYVLCVFHMRAIRVFHMCACYTCRAVNYRLLDRRAAGVVISHRS